MTQPRLFEVCVPVLIRYLGTLDRILVAVDSLPLEQTSRALTARLAPDMLSLAEQVETATNFALRTAYPMTGRSVPSFISCEPTIPSLCGRVTDTVALLEVLAPQEFEGAELRTISEKAGIVRVELPAVRFLSEYGLPNFFFHLNMAYAIARMQGSVLGKAQYDGFHVYARRPNLSL